MLDLDLRQQPGLVDAEGSQLRLQQIGIANDVGFSEQSTRPPHDYAIVLLQAEKVAEHTVIGGRFVIVELAHGECIRGEHATIALCSVGATLT